MKTLREIFDNPIKGDAFKVLHYFEIYEKTFSEFRDKEITFLEIGIDRGGSLWMWKEYFSKARIVGIDISKKAKDYEGEGVKIHIGDQADSEFLKRVSKESGPFDIVLDDGGHKMDQIITSCKTLFPLLKRNGIYFIEDLITSYWKDWGGTYRGKGTAMEFLKGLADCFYWKEHKQEPESYFNENLESIEFHNSIVILRKSESSNRKTGPIRSKNYYK